MTYLLGRLLNLIRPRQGWLAFLLTWTALLCTIAGVQEARWVLPDEIRFIISLTLAGGFLGLGLARSPLRDSLRRRRRRAGAAALVTMGPDASRCAAGRELDAPAFLGRAAERMVVACARR